MRSNAFLQFPLKVECWKPHKAAHQPTICDVINDVNLFPTFYHRYTVLLQRFDVIKSDNALQDQVQDFS